MKEIQHGVIAAVVTPLNDDESIDVESLGRLVEWVLRWGVKGLFVGGSIGEGAALRDRERARLARETVRLVRGRALVLAGVSDIGTIRLKDNIDQIADAGVDAVVTTPRIMFPSRNVGDTQRLMEAVAAHSRVPVWFYENPGMTPVKSAFDEIASIMALPNVAGLKFSAQDRELYARCAREFAGRVPVYNGNVPDIAYAAQLGTGALVGIGGLLPGLCVKIWNLAGAERLQAQINSVYDIYLGKNWPLWPSAQKHVLKRRGIFRTSVATAPFARLTADQERQIDAVLSRIDDTVFEPLNRG
ncbi:MAG: dihydrodipicolinate synthase family protein [Opitutaceae bacterium]|nr:dihydrodipicolinate synthase family protein [Opitutaceae bacterium]